MNQDGLHQLNKQNSQTHNFHLRNLREVPLPILPAQAGCAWCCGRCRHLWELARFDHLPLVQTKLISPGFLVSLHKAPSLASSETFPLSLRSWGWGPGLHTMMLTGERVSRHHPCHAVGSAAEPVCARSVLSSCFPSLSRTQNAATASSSRKGNLKPFSLHFDRAVTTPESLGRAGSRDFVLINICKIKPPLHSAEEHPWGADPLPACRGPSGTASLDARH